MERLYAIADIGGTGVVAGICDNKQILYRCEQDTVKKGNITALPEQVDFLIGYACGKAGVSKKDIQALGISTCSPFVIIDGEKYLATPNICGGLAKERGVLENDWTLIPLDGFLKKIYQNVRSANDCASSALAEHLFGALQGYRNGAYVTWSTGIGAGALIDGRLIGGENENAAHLGHMIMVPNGRLCGCGNKGDLEAEAAGTSIMLQYKERTGQGIKTEDVFARYNTDSNAKEIIDRAAALFGTGLANMTILYDTKRICIGGSVYSNNQELLEPLVKEEFYKAFPALTKKTEIVPAGLGDNVGDVAALSLVIDEGLVKDWNERKPWKEAPKAEEAK